MLRSFVKKSLKMVLNSVCKGGFSNQNLTEINKLGFEDAVKHLNLLQTNASVIQQSGTRFHTSECLNVKDTEKYLTRCGISLENLDNLNVIHVTGTKGKGSACALCESILRGQGYKTGFFSSPHLVSVTERIRINGRPINRDCFSKYFWSVYSSLRTKREHENDMPPYFKFLTVLAFNVFISERVDVAIIEVGIGGEYDCTNVLRNVSTVGITSLGLEHTSLLGNTIEQIAWQKAGIMKPGCRAFTVQQSSEAMKVIQDRAIEKNCKVNIVPEYTSYKFEGKQPNLKINTDVQKINASLAIQMAQHWMLVKQGKELNNIKQMQENEFRTCDNDIILNVPEIFAQGLTDCFWPGRCQIFDYNKTRLYLDGAHTFESMQVCVNWFQHNVRNNYHKVLMFNITGDRDSKYLLQLLHKCNFNEVIFVPNIAFESCDSSNDQTNYSNPMEVQMHRCKMNKELWLNIQAESENIEDISNSSKLNIVHTFTCTSNVLKYLNNAQNNQGVEVLVTGSLHLIGSVLAVVDPNLTTSYNI